MDEEFKAADGELTDINTNEVADKGLVASDSTLEQLEGGLDDNRALCNIPVFGEPGIIGKRNGSIAEQVIEPTLVLFEAHIPPSSMLDGVHAQHFLAQGWLFIILQPWDWLQLIRIQLQFLYKMPCSHFLHTQ